MRNGEEMWSNGQIQGEICQFGYLGYVWHTKQCRMSKIHAKQAFPQPFTMHKNTCKDHADEEWWRDGVKRTNRSKDMAVCAFGVRLTHKTVQKGKCVAVSKPFKTHKNTRKAHTDEEWWRDGAKRTNRCQDIAVCVFWVRLTHKTVKKGEYTAKTNRPNAIYNA